MSGAISRRKTLDYHWVWEKKIKQEQKRTKELGKGKKLAKNENVFFT